MRGLKSIRGFAHAVLRFECFYDCGVYFYLNDRTNEGLEAVEEALVIAKKTRDDELLRKTHHLRGVILGEAGRIPEAVIAYADALSLARKTRNPIGEGRTLINLGVAFNYCSLYREAIPCFRLAIEKLSTHEPSDNGGCAALANWAQSHYFMGEYEEAYDLIAEAVRHSQSSSEAFAAAGLTIRHFIAFRIALELGKLREAEQHLKKCVEHSIRGDTVRSRFVAQLATGLYAVFSGDVARGLALLTQALDRSGKNGAYYEEALSSLVRAHDHLGQPEVALEYMRLLREHLTKLRGSAVSLVRKAKATDADLVALKLRESQLQTKVAQNTALSRQVEMLERLAVTADLKEDASGEHGYRVGRLSALMAEELGWTKDACLAIDHAARLHDIGKIAMPDRILLTSEQLKEAERHLMSTHTLVGAELLAKSNIPQLQMAEEIARFHHEWWNGAGYPSRRKEKRIPIHARIVALADVFDALTHGRPFAEPWSMDRALEEIAARRGTQFDPELTDLFLQLVGRLRKRHKDLDAYLGKAGLESPFLQARHKIRLMLAEPQDVAKTPVAKAAEAVH